MSAVGDNLSSPRDYAVSENVEAHLRLKEEKILFKKILTINPENLDALNGYRNILLKQKKVGKAQIQGLKIASIVNKLSMQTNQDMPEFAFPCENQKRPETAFTRDPSTTCDPCDSGLVVEPLKLRNIGNSCYIGSVLQSLFCVETFVEQLRKPLERKELTKEEFEKAVAIHQELLKFINSTDWDAEGWDAEGPSLFRLRDAIFKSGLHPDFELEGLCRQHDAIHIMELILSKLMPFEFKVQSHCTTEVFPGLDFVMSLDSYDILPIPFAVHEGRKLLSLRNLITMVLHKKLEEEKRQFNPKEAVIVDQEKAATILNYEPIKVAKYHRSEHLLELKPLMVLKINRFTFTDGTFIKISDWVALPLDGIIDLNRFYDVPLDHPKNAVYKIKSYVAHLGSRSDGGHYVSYVEKGGRYFRCDDFYKNEEISRDEFLHYREAYLIVLERLTSEEITQVQEAAAAAVKAQAKKEAAINRSCKETVEEKMPTA